MKTIQDGQQKSTKMIRVRNITFERLKQFGELGESVDAAVSRCIDYAEKSKQELIQKVTA